MPGWLKNMQNCWYKRVVTVGIIILFLGSSVVSSISGDLSKSNILEKGQDESVNRDAIDNVESREDPSGEIRSNSLVKSADRDKTLQGRDADWIFRKQITIDHNLVLEDLVNFPVLISNTSFDFSYEKETSLNSILLSKASFSTASCASSISDFISRITEILSRETKAFRISA